MSNVIPFDFEGHAVRTLIRDGEPWFVLADVCRVLEVGNPSDAARRLDDDEKATLDNIEGHSGQRGGAQSFIIINESGLYAIILTSRKPAAKRFRRWVTGEVLPSIRRTGAYFVAQDNTAPEPEEPPVADTCGVDQLPARTAEMWLQMVREARLLSGPDAARALWAVSPLPALPYLPAGARHSERHGETLAVDPAAKTWPGTPEGRLMAVLSLKAGDGRTVAQMIEAGDCRSFLARNGVLTDPPGWRGFIAIANTGPATQLAWGYARGDGRRALMMLDGVRDGGKPFRFGRASSRAVLVPLALLHRVPRAA